MRPKFIGPDNQLREVFTFSTTLPYRFFTGEISANTIDMQVSIRGNPFVSDPDLIVFEGTSFIIPNPSAYPDGLQLLTGDNQIQVKAILSNSQVFGPSVINARLVQESDIRSVISAPSGIFIERFDRTVKITIDGLDDPDVIGYNFWASTSPGGGSSGYQKINISPVITGEISEQEDLIQEILVNSSIALNLDGSPKADPLYFTLTGIQENQDEELIQTDFREQVLISETVRNLRTVVTVKDLRQLTQYSFVHDRQATFNSNPNPAIPNAAWSTIQIDDPIYYVATAVYVIDNEEYESAFSPEVVGSPLVVTPGVGAFPQVSRQQITQSAILSIFRTQPDLDIKPGSYTRDVFLDPFSTEAERIRFIIDFLHRAQSFATLIPIDDPTFSGQSVPVSQSAYKQALKQAFFLQNDAAVQTIIDNSFDKFASNFGITRRTGTRSRGSVTLSLRQRPTSAVNLGLGTVVLIGGNRYRLTSTVNISPNGSGAFFNPTTGRYSASAFVQAEDPGSQYNLTPGQIGYLESGPRNIEIQNESEIFGGQDEESNLRLAERAQAKLSSVDSGTEQGITQKIIDVAGISQVNVVSAGHPLMFRDFDGSVHTGGAVDVWVRGNRTYTVTDNFAFAFESVKSAQFEPIGDPQDLRFRVVHPDVTPDNPIIELLDFPSYGYEFKNVSQSYTFDVTNSTVVAYNVVQLDPEVNDPVVITLADVIRGAFRFRSGSNYVFSRQPVKSITSFVGESSGTISPLAYSLFKLDDPLLLGNSIEAKDYIKVTAPDELPEGATIPANVPLTITDEAHVILDGLEYLNRLGVNPLTVQVYDSTRTTLYNSPFAPNVTADYTFIETTDPQTPLGIALTSGSNITNGQSLSIDYTYDENFTVTYEVASLVRIAQNKIDSTKHVNADILVKAAIESPIDLSITCVLKNSQDVQTSPAQADGEIRTALARFFNPLSLGEPVRPSDIINVIDGVSSVSYVVTPLTKMVRASGNYILREQIIASQDSDIAVISAWSSPLVTVALFKNKLSWPTQNAGGPNTIFRGVFQNETNLTHYETPPDVNGLPLRVAPNGSFIIGDGGLAIPGYSDDTTLINTFTFSSDSVVRAREIIAKRKEITQNRILISYVISDSPLNHAYYVTYVVSDVTGAFNIDTGPTEYLTLGQVDLTFDIDQDFRSRLVGRR